MMNVAIILAGGTGTRVGANLPKQFIQVNGKSTDAMALPCSLQTLILSSISSCGVSGDTPKLITTMSLSDWVNGYGSQSLQQAL
mgnify:CR=1 FL=1